MLVGNQRTGCRKGGLAQGLVLAFRKGGIKGRDNHRANFAGPRQQVLPRGVVTLGPGDVTRLHIGELDGEREAVGAVGYGRDRIGKIRYAIFDRSAGSVELRALGGPLLPLDYALR